MSCLNKIYAVVVSHQSDPDRLIKQFDLLLNQVDVIAWVDNASSDSLRQLQYRWIPDRVRTIWLEDNQGIGAAQNRGIEWALTQGATHVLLMDDDSLPAPDMVKCLLSVLADRPLASAAGACYADPRRGVERTPFSAIIGGRLKWLTCTNAEKVWEVDHVIASGCLIPAPVLRDVGLMREDFFIDWVDTEWCLRSRCMGYSVYGVCSAQLNHALGDKVHCVLGHEIPVHAPWRHYYQARNFVLMLRSCHVERGIKAHMAFRQFKRFLVFSILMPGRWDYFWMWIRGVLHGFQGRSGPLIRPKIGVTST